MDAFTDIGWFLYISLLQTIYKQCILALYNGEEKSNYGILVGHSQAAMSMGGKKRRRNPSMQIEKRFGEQ